MDLQLELMPYHYYNTLGCQPNNKRLIVQFDIWNGYWNQIDGDESSLLFQENIHEPIS